MPEWQDWYQMAKESQDAAQELAPLFHRSTVSRIYYSAYQAVTAVLLYKGCVPPAQREAWSHEETPGMIIDQWRTLVSRDVCKDLANRLRDLYKLRVSADYASEDEIGDSSVKTAMKNGNFIVKSATDILTSKGIRL